MNKCDCYHTQQKTRYTYNPITGAPIGHDIEVGVCWGTRECDECSCGGDETKCDFYPEIREKALKEQAPKFGEWISVEDRLPEEDEHVLVYKKGEVHVYRYVGDDEWWDEDGWNTTNGFRITHWMPLPELPKGE